MKKVLHVLNGDALLPLFEASNVAGEILIWKESMFEGPVTQDFDMEFWKARRMYLQAAYGDYGLVLRPHKEWTDVVEATMAKGPWDEIVLWFEHDLFCQMNLLTVLNWLPTQTTPHQISRAIPLHEHQPALFPNLTGEEMQAAFQSRLLYDAADLEFARQAWTSYTSANPQALYALQDEITQGFPDLKPALHAHFYRFPSIYNGLDKVEELLLRIVEAGGVESIKSLVDTFQEMGEIYGLGDWQILRYIRKISPQLLQFDGGEISSRPVKMQLNYRGPITVTELGDDILWHRKNWLNYHDFNEWRGGVLLHKNRSMYFWDPIEFTFV